jgi:cell cycle arrest protein BUB3
MLRAPMPFIQEAGVVIMSEIQLSSPPSDGVSNVVFGRHTPDSLLVSSWDCGVRLYNTTQNVEVLHYQHKAAVLDVCFGRSDSQCFSGSVDRSVRMCDLSTGVDSHVGSHENSVKSVAYLRGAGVLVTGRWSCQFI